MSVLRRILVPAVLIALAAAPGCLSSKPTRLYLLSASMPPGEARDCPGGPHLIVGVGPARLPAYLDRPQLVTRAGPNELRLSELDEWAEPLGENLSRVVARNLEGLLCAVAFPLSVSGPGEADCRVAIEVIRFDGAPGGEAVLEARWSVYGAGGGKPLSTREARHSLQVQGRSPEDLVAAFSSLAASLSRDIAGFLKTVRPPGSAGNTGPSSP